MDLDFDIVSASTAIISLLACACDALCFPATFWTNISVYSYVIYTIWDVLNEHEYSDMLHSIDQTGPAYPQILA